MAYAPKTRVCDAREHKFGILSEKCSKCQCTMDYLLQLAANYINMYPPRELECDEPGGEHVMVDAHSFYGRCSDEELKFLYCKFCGKTEPRE